jgi:hypothetical protein
MGTSEGTITECLQRWRDGDPDALARLTDAVYQQLRRMAARYSRGESDNDVLQPTALVHELYMQLPGLRHIDFQSRSHFLGIGDHAGAAQMHRLNLELVRRVKYPGDLEAREQKLFG